ncbi:DMT family transporter [Segetibacter koreensis]|uniref:DMT family transporter n=1 Tax=Segetibacter koreensis TaxID=398037 RepID=UPI00035E6BE5|nr:DMT family transporter [Segetibacter koreensis]
MAFSNSKQYTWIVAGILFAILWASASAATKIGLADAQPLVIAQVRFMIAAVVMLVFSHLIKRYALPTGKEWKYLTVYGLLNITVYLGCYVVAMQHVTAGIGSLAVATNPLFISLISVFFLRKRLQPATVIAIILGTAGVMIASWPLFKQATVTTAGLLLLLFSMLSYSAGAIYFSTKEWNGLHLFTINGWQTLIGGMLLLPVTLITYHNTNNHFTPGFWLSVLWLAVPVSIFAVQIWLWLLSTNAVKAGLWLFLCPVFGFAIAAWLTHDVISSYTIAGVALVLAGLFLAQKSSKQSAGS